MQNFPKPIRCVFEKNVHFQLLLLQIDSTAAIVFTLLSYFFFVALIHRHPFLIPVDNGWTFLVVGGYFEMLAATGFSVFQLNKKHATVVSVDRFAYAFAFSLIPAVIVTFTLLLVFLFRFVKIVFSLLCCPFLLFRKITAFEKVIPVVDVV